MEAGRQAFQDDWKLWHNSSLSGRSYIVNSYATDWKDKEKRMVKELATGRGNVGRERLSWAGKDTAGMFVSPL